MCRSNATPRALTSAVVGESGCDGRDVRAGQPGDRFGVGQVDRQAGRGEVAEHGVLTPTMKLRRKPIGERYADLIEEMYREPQR